MRTIILLGFVLAAPVAAQPAPPPARAAAAGAPCDVTIVRAPDAVRAEVEAWVHAEPHCGATLEVRIVPTASGLYLLAQDHDGHTYERVVPDAESAGVLIASWSADDGVRPVPPPLPAPGPAAGMPDAAPGLAPPGLTVHVAPAHARSRWADKWMSLGGIAEMRSGYSGGGVAGEIDLATWGPGFSVGVAAAVVHSNTNIYGEMASGSLDTEDYKATGYLAYTLRLGAFRLRPSIGGGVIYTKANASLQDYSMLPGTLRYLGDDGVFPMGTAAVTAGVVLGPSWELSAGPVGTLLEQRYQLVSPSNATSGYLVHRDAALGFFVGLRRRL